jgi:type I restriction enzyme S subunit
MTLDEANAIRVYQRRCSDIRASLGLRFGFRYLHPKHDLLERERLHAVPTLKLKALCTRAITRGVQPQYDDSEIRAVKTANLKNGYLDWEEVQTVDENCYKANQFRAAVRKGDVLIASTGVGSLGKVDVYEDDTPALADGHISIVRVDSQRINPRLLAHLLRGRVAQWQIERQLSGATNQIDIYPDQLAALRLPEITPERQRQIMPRITKIESDITDARGKVRPQADIINEILCKAFGYPLAEYRKWERERQFAQGLSSFGDSFSLRGSVKFHHPDYELTDDFFARVAYQRVKAFLAVPIRLGVSLTNEVMDEEGEAFYVHPSATRHQGRINPTDCHRITMEYFEQNKRRGSLRPGDVLINRSGEALGKVALFDRSEPCLFSDFTMRVRFADNMNPVFAWYYFRSVIFQSQVEREARGMSLPNIFPSQVETLLVPVCRRQRQDALADQITIALVARQRELQTIESGRHQITNLIESALSATTSR